MTVLNRVHYCTAGVSKCEIKHLMARRKVKEEEHH